MKVIGPLGEELTIADLPPRDTTRWIVRRKAEVVAAVTGGMLSIADVMARYDLSREEYANWERAVDRAGVPGLRVTRRNRCRIPERQSTRRR